ncbi:MAG: hypothetical protein R3E31_06870 [Chloroflexota bacterium]
MIQKQVGTVAGQVERFRSGITTKYMRSAAKLLCLALELAYPAFLKIASVICLPVVLARITTLKTYTSPSLFHEEVVFGRII